MRGVDPEGSRAALDRATELLIQVAGGEAYGDIHDVYPQPVKKRPVTVATSTISSRLGYECDAKVFQDWMVRLGCDVKDKGGETFEVLPPTFRFDLEMEMDLVEEYARLHGYDHIPETFPALKREPLLHDTTWTTLNRIVPLLRSYGFSQASNYAFVSQKSEAAFLQNETRLQKSGFELPLKSVRLRNPLSEDWNVMRRSLSFGLYRNCVHNFHQGQESGALFEVGPCFGEAGAGDYKEEWRIAGVMWGSKSSLWVKENAGHDVFALKSALEGLFNAFFLSGFELIQPKDRGELPQFLHRGQAGWVTYQAKDDGKSGASTSFNGFMGAVHPAILDEDKMRVPVAIFEIGMKPFNAAKTPLHHYRGFSRFPSVTRDLSLVMPKSLPAGDVMNAIRESAGEVLRSVIVFDQFEGGNLEKAQKSVSFRMLFQDKNGTLQDELVQGRVQAILDSVKQKWGLETR